MARGWQDHACHVHIHQSAIKENLYRVSVTRTAWQVGSAGISSVVLEREYEIPLGLSMREAVADVLDRVAQAVIDS